MTPDPEGRVTAKRVTVFGKDHAPIKNQGAVTSRKETSWRRSGRLKSIPPVALAQLKKGPETASS